jgi:hypothetical protein
VHSQAGVSQNYANDFRFTQIVNIIAPKLMLSQARKHECAFFYIFKIFVALLHLVGNLFEFYDDVRTYKPYIYKCQTGNSDILIQKHQAKTAQEIVASG